MQEGQSLCICITITSYHTVQEPFIHFTTCNPHPNVQEENSQQWLNAGKPNKPYQCHIRCTGCVYTTSIHCLSICVHSHPEHSKRPGFHAIGTKLQSQAKKILKWEHDLINSSSPMSLVLGSPLEHGQELYKDLQNCYK